MLRQSFASCSHASLKESGCKGASLAADFEHEGLLALVAFELVSGMRAKMYKDAEARTHHGW